ncbi:MAG: ABC transporter substrate-binding protein [Oscillospiraceae bacterium]|jgi:peptide/nickel transport system substrate-binding protein|nr:ABC transporter substrate-binding protein [Oscillospiraceae bacterium]
MRVEKYVSGIIPLLLALIMIPALFSGCRSDSGDKILRFGGTGIDGKFNPILSDTVYDNYIVDMLFEALMDVDAEGQFIPVICTYTLSDDQKTYTFTLKDGIKFSDGKPMTSEDVAFTYLTVAHPDYSGPRAYAVSRMAGYGAYHDGAADHFEGIKVIDDKTISFTFDTASPANINCFIYGIMSKSHYAFDRWEDFMDLAANPVGSGRLVLDAYEPKQYVRLNKNAAYWDAETALKIDGVLISEVPTESLMGAMQTNQIDFCQPDANPDNYNAYADMSGVTTRTFLGNGYTYMCFNTARDKLSDVRVRQALMHALDRKTFIETEYGADLASPGMAPISPASWAYPDEGSMNDYAFDMTKAEELMRGAGWEKGADGFLEKDGERFTLNWLVYTDAKWPQTLSGMAADTWKQLGVDLKIELMDFVTVRSRTMDPEPEDKDFDVFTMGFTLDAEPDPSGALFDYDAYVKGGFNASGYYNERAQELIALGRKEFDTAKRAEVYKEWAGIMNDQIPCVIIANRKELWVVNDRIKGFENNTFQNWVRFLPNITIE